MQIMQQASIQQQNVVHPFSRVKCPDRPGTEVDLMDSDWAMFLDSWQQYKTTTKLKDPTEFRNELMSTCSNALV